MRRSALTLAISTALLAAGCGKSDCQLMEERLCSCTGATSDQCATQAENLLKELGPGQSVQDQCNGFLSSCNPPNQGSLCEWIHTQAGKVACGLAIDPTSDTSVVP